MKRSALCAERFDLYYRGALMYLIIYRNPTQFTEYFHETKK